MRVERRKQIGLLAFRIFEALVGEPHGLTIESLAEKVQTGNISQKKHPQFQDMMRSCIAPIKAGWLISRSSFLAISEDGRSAYKTYSDPVEFITQAARRSAKGWLSVEFPRSYFTLTKIKENFIVEAKAIRRIGLGQTIKHTFLKQESWQNALPLQAPRRILLPAAKIESNDQLISSISGLAFSEGGHTLYLPPDSWRSGPFANAALFYPADAGLKISKHRGSVDESEYVRGAAKGDSVVHLRSVYSHRHLTLVANLLNTEGIGPRLYDLVELQCANSIWSAYVVQHVDGRVPSQEECISGVSKIRDLQQRGLIRVILPEGFNDEEFECPGCSNNAFVDQNGKFQYIDFQNFNLSNYGEYLTQQAQAAVQASHFGDMSAVQGARYLYQSVPGVSLRSKRGIDKRVTQLKRLFADGGTSVQDRLVLDIGCNIGMMMAQYLKMGASWCHGWDRSHVTPWTEKLLFALGCTRFSTTGGDIVSSQPIRDNLSSHLNAQLAGCAVSYLAIRGHIGWLDALAKIPWTLLIYEGHEGESNDDFDYHLKQLRLKTNLSLGPVTTYSDGESEPRTLALIFRA
jgi:hypothetical protein